MTDFDRNTGIWLSENKDILQNYECKFIAITEEGIIASGNDMWKVDEEAKKQGKEYINYYVPKNINTLRIIPLFIRPLTWKLWQPFYPVELIGLNNKVIKEEAIIDPGADMTCIPYQLGTKLGFQKAPQEPTITLNGIGGEVEVLQRDITLKIDGHLIVAPAAWMQSESELQLLIGRLKVFDYFDITFKQADKKIEFYWRGQDNNRAAEPAVEYSLENNAHSA